MERVQHTRLVNTQFTSNTYILFKEGEKVVWVVDPGDVQPVFDWMQLNEKEMVAGILLTHTHFDHFYGATEILQRFSCPIYIANEYGQNGLFDAKQNGSRYSDYNVVTVPNGANILLYPDTIQLWPNEMLSILHTPGHSEDSVCLQVDDLLFTGDTLIYNLRTVTKLRGGDIVKLRDSIELLQTLSGKGLRVCPGHNEEFMLDGYDVRKALSANAPTMSL